ncbi:hypothetical protein EJ06DRAFT_525872 [Trichodelitschia bisporula]|uniref:Uncharacterized protein n=1 Tax=Trichodelitschia bisporula TaxID=703511 RepID=A0A6G1IAW8_9PEZI|nr:hypothetical protein EJ06DRAFT_525872 [Trichodelitschia bisporula]
MPNPVPHSPRTCSRPKRSPPNWTMQRRAATPRITSAQSGILANSVPAPTQRDTRCAPRSGQLVRTAATPRSDSSACWARTCRYDAGTRGPLQRPTRFLAARLYRDADERTAECVRTRALHRQLALIAPSRAMMPSHPIPAHTRRPSRPLTRPSSRPRASNLRDLAHALPHFLHPRLHGPLFGTLPRPRFARNRFVPRQSAALRCPRLR